MKKFRDRKEAGITLAKYLNKEIDISSSILLALPRGGVPIAYELSCVYSIPMDVFMVRKLGVPSHPELAMGAIASGNTIIFNEQLINNLKLSKETISQVIQSEKKELARREKVYRGERAFPRLSGSTVILVDDGMATGATMKAAVSALKKHHPHSIVIAVPVAPPETCREFGRIVDKVICPVQPDNFEAVGLWYDYFPQVTDNEVKLLLEQSPYKQPPL